MTPPSRSAHRTALHDSTADLEVAAVSLCGPVRVENRDAWERCRVG